MIRYASSFIVVSASHNPYEDNGIKIFSPDGKKVGEEIERAIEGDIADAERIVSSSDEPGFDELRAPVFQAAYSDHLYDKFGDLRLNGFKIAVDCANGAASNLAPELFRRLCLDVHLCLLQAQRMRDAWVFWRPS